MHWFDVATLFFLAMLFIAFCGVLLIGYLENRSSDPSSGPGSSQPTSAEELTRLIMAPGQSLVSAEELRWYDEKMVDAALWAAFDQIVSHPADPVQSSYPAQIEESPTKLRQVVDLYMELHR